MIARPSWQLFFVLLAFVVGVAIHSFIDVPLSAGGLILVSGASFLVGVLLLPKRVAWTLFIFAALLFGLWRYSVSFPVTAQSIASNAGQSVRVTGTIVDDVTLKPSSQQVTLGALEVNDEAATNKLLATLPRYPELHYGETISFVCVIETPQPFSGFAYDRYLLRVGIVAVCDSSKAPAVVSDQGGNVVQRGLFALRHDAEHLLQVALPEPAASLAAGLILGVQQLPTSVADDFRKIGTSHIVAASGYNVSVVLAMLLGALSYFMKRQRAFWLLLAGIVAYVCVAGAGAAVVRAGIMGAITIIAMHSGRKSSVRNLLALSAAVMLLGNPRLLRDDVGFQLSMLATIGLVILSPWVTKKLSFLPKAFQIRESLAATLCATIFTFPILLINFHQFSLLSPIANLLILPFVPYAMLLSFLAAILAFIRPELGILFGGFAWSILELMILLAHALAAV